MPQWQWWMPRKAKCGFAGQGIATPKSPQGAIRQTQFRRKAQNGARCYDLHEEEELFICHIHNYTEYNQQWNVFSAFNQSKCTHTWSSGQPTLWRPGSSWGFGALLKGHLSRGQFLPEPRFEPTTSGYKSNALSIRATTALKMKIRVISYTCHIVISEITMCAVDGHTAGNAVG